MEEKDTEGTVLSHMKPVVTMLTDTLEKDFIPSYHKAGKPYEDNTYIRIEENGDEVLIGADQLQEDVEAWLLSLEHRMETDSDRAYARIIATMIHKNQGWVTLLTNRVKRRLA